MNTKPNRQTIRLKHHDYTSENSYFITICTHNRSHLFGKIIDGVVLLNDTGKMAHQCWLQIPNHFPNTEIDNFIIMPNHIHGIIHMHPMTHVGANHYSPEYPANNDSPVSIATDNKTNYSNSCINDTIQSQNVNMHPDVNDFGDSDKNNTGEYPCKFRVNDDSLAIWANDCSGTTRANDDSVTTRANDDSVTTRANDDSVTTRANDDSPLQVRRWGNGTSNSVGSIVRGFKIGVTKYVRQHIPECIVWQRNYWEHIIRDKDQLYRIRQYIINNPQKWYLDKLNGGCGNQVLETVLTYGYESWMI